MQRHVHLEVLDIAEPCAEDWDAMTGDGHRRHCGTCDRDVFDLSRLTADEAEALLATGACVRFYRRADGTVTTIVMGAAPIEYVPVGEVEEGQ